MEVQPPVARVVHPLPPAPRFIGRAAELDILRRFWRAGHPGVLALVGLGGSGKTALVARFLEELFPGRSDLSPPHGLLVWSFYQEPDTESFLRTAHAYFGGPTAASSPARGIGSLHLLRERLESGGPHLLVLDGLERVQCESGSRRGEFGQLEDPLLKDLLARIAGGVGRTFAIITSRFPLADLESSRGRGYTHLDVDQMELTSAVELLRRCGVKGSDGDLASLVSQFGSHPLTLDHLGGLIGQFLEGDPRRAPELPALSDPAADRQALRLARLLRAYEDHLPTGELALLTRLCMLRRSVTEEQMATLFLCSPVVSARSVRRDLAQLLSLKLGSERTWWPIGKQAHTRSDEILASYQTWEDPEADAVDVAEAIEQVVEEASSTAPIAGPASTFSQEVRLAMEQVFDLEARDIELEFGDLARRYANSKVDVPTDLLPLPTSDRKLLRVLWERYEVLRRHPCVAGGGSKAALAIAFTESGLASCAAAAEEIAEDRSPAEIRRVLNRTRRHLRRLLFKHLALRRVRQLCHIYQQKWSLAGPIARADHADLHQLIESLVGRHLILREADGRFSVHPAVRDHFQHRCAARERASWHEVIREQLVSLSQRPGVRLPEDPATLDLIEEAVYHAIESDQPQLAEQLYEHSLGGHQHLAWKLGEMSRGLRILQGFRECPDPWALAWYLRALGELQAAYDQHTLAFFRADIRILQGRLPEVAAEGDSSRTAIAQFLMGRTCQVPAEPFGCAIPRGELLLYLGRYHAAYQSCQLARLYRKIGWEGDWARYALVSSEVACRQGDIAQCCRDVQEASTWILRSGSVEHLCRLHRVRAQAAQTQGDLSTFIQQIQEGQHVARQFGLKLDLIELLCDHAEQQLRTGDAEGARTIASDALRQAAAPDCQYMWGAARAGHILGKAALEQKSMRFAHLVLKRTLATRQRIGDPGACETERLLRQIASQT